MVQKTNVGRLHSVDIYHTKYMKNNNENHEINIKLTM